jgi:GATA-binding protein
MSQVQISDTDERHDPTMSRPASPQGLRAAVQAPHPANIAPSHMFDAVTLDGAGHRSQEHSFVDHSAYYGQPTRNEDVSGLSILNGTSSQFDNQANSTTTLKTRVSELEVINELFRGRVNELETSERELQRQLQDSRTREHDLLRHIEQMQQGHLGGMVADDEERQHKRLRTSDFINDDSDLVDSQLQDHRGPVEGENTGPKVQAGEAVANSI